MTMSETQVNRFKSLWGNANEDIRWDFGFWVAGLAIMAGAIIVQFGWIGTLFCAGAVIWKAGDHGLNQGENPFVDGKWNNQKIPPDAPDGGIRWQ